MARYSAAVFSIGLLCTFSYTFCQTTLEYKSLNRKINLMRETFEKCSSLHFEVEDLKLGLQAEQKLTAALSEQLLVLARPQTHVNQEKNDVSVDLLTDADGVQRNITEHGYGINELKNRISELEQSTGKTINHAIHNLSSDFQEIVNKLKIIEKSHIHIANNVVDLNENAAMTKTFICAHGTLKYDSDNNHTSCECNPGYRGLNCKNDKNECSCNPCKNGGHCYNERGTFSCSCISGWTGVDCGTDVDECTLGTDNCNATAAACTNTDGFFTCSCNNGYHADGMTCTVPDDDECNLGTDNCDENAACANTDGSFTCSCNCGYIGDGITCTDDPATCSSSDLSCQSVRSCTLSYSEYYGVGRRNVHSCGCAVTCYDCNDSCVDNAISISSAEYTDLMDYRWLIKTTSDKRIVVSFSNVDLEGKCRYDSLYVYGGTTVETGVFLGRVCVNGDTSTFSTSSSSMLVRFQTDYSNHYNGFTARVCFIDK